jgi:SAM-dependent methyltransferase
MHEKDALKFARGKVLDVGCGAGRHALYLQRRGLSVTAIDISPSIVELAHTRGVRDARVADVCKALPFKNGEFNTVVLFGNNLGICGTAVRFQRMLRELARVTTPDTRILGTTRQPSAFRRSERRYTRDGSGESEVSQVRLRLTDEKRTGEWFDFLLFSPTGLWQLAEKAGWEIEYLFGEDLDRGYAVVLKKS